MAVFVKRMERNGTVLFIGPISFLKVLLKINLNILIFYIKLITIYHFSNKKITTKHSYFFTFLYKTFLLFFFFLFHINQIWYSTAPFPNPIPFTNTTYIYFF
jgi:hypothetical protein